LAAESDNTAAVLALLSARPELCTIQDKMGRNCLHWACAALNIVVIGRICAATGSEDVPLGQHAASAATTTSGETPMHWLAKALSSKNCSGSELEALLLALAPVLGEPGPWQCSRAGTVPSALLTSDSPAVQPVRLALQSAEAGLSGELAAAVAPIQRTTTGVPLARGRAPAGKKRTLKVGQVKRNKPAE
jgi:hypothetical protein